MWPAEQCPSNPYLVFGLEPSPEEFIEWSKSWANEMWLCSKISSTDVDYVSTSASSINLPSQQVKQSLLTKRGVQLPEGTGAYTIDGETFYAAPPHPITQHFGPPQSVLTNAAYKQMILEAKKNLTKDDANRVRLVELSPGVRKQANALADEMLRRAGASQEVIRSFKQVLPYKMAHLERLQNPRVAGITVPLMVFAGDASNPAFSRNTEKLTTIYATLRHDWDEFRRMLDTFRKSAKFPGPQPEYREYVFVSNNRLHGRSGSDGVLKSSKEYDHMIETVRNKRNFITSAIIFQVRS